MRVTGRILSYLLSAASSHSFKTRHEYETVLAILLGRCLGHGIAFTHGDFALHNILVYNGHVSGFIDSECAGWCPEYWEFTTPLRWHSQDPENGSLFLQLGGHPLQKGAGIRLGNCIVDCGFVHLLLVGCALNHMKLLAIDYGPPTSHTFDGYFDTYTVSLQLP